MEENGLKLLKDYVITHCRNGRRYYDPTVKQALIHATAMPGAPIAELAREHGVEANQLRRWVKRYRNEHDRQSPASAPPPANPFVPVTVSAAGLPSAPSSLTVRLPNGIEIDFPQGDGATLASLLDLLWRLPCFASTRT
jgi:transposase